jgi:cell division protein ZapA
MEQITLRILDRDYRLACEPEEKESLLACAKYVGEKMESIQSSRKVMGADRIAVMAALQIAHELFAARRNDTVESEEVRRRVRDITKTCDEALLPQEKLL